MFPVKDSGFPLVQVIIRYGKYAYVANAPTAEEALINIYKKYGLIIGLVEIKKLRTTLQAFSSQS